MLPPQLHAVVAHFLQRYTKSLGLQNGQTLVHLFSVAWKEAQGHYARTILAKPEPRIKQVALILRYRQAKTHTRLLTIRAVIIPILLAVFCERVIHSVKTAPLDVLLICSVGPVSVVRMPGVRVENVRMVVE